MIFTLKQKIQYMSNTWHIQTTVTLHMALWKIKIHWLLSFYIYFVCLWLLNSVYFSLQIHFVPLMTHNHSSILRNDGRVVIVGGGGNCFSFGTHFNKGLTFLDISTEINWQNGLLFISSYFSLLTLARRYTIMQQIPVTSHYIISLAQWILQIVEVW